ncbi:MAG: AMP-binding protein [Eubacteriales bacterium]|jgi:fatty-acyl-CoA synthase|nr:AMP-binding protein [Clostridiales bacterium]MDY2684520.1 AMP-binding protein [Eubacteriales bacterium]MEE0399992.1 AMP-binding protein [Christensenellales bacterium]MCI6814359.1 AMP-binding protein [Clostridiales bacterium]MDY2971621.1 AMP-binding protein [Eubacteriales bacterium]
MEFIENTLGGVLDDLSKNNPNGWAVRYTDRNYFRTWKELNDEADLIARGMMSLGVKKGDHVAIWATNTPEWILTLFAAAKIGAVLVTVNTNFKIFELEYLLRQSDTKLLVMIGGFKNNDYVATVNELLPELKTTSGEIESEHLPFLKRVVFAGKETPEGMLNFEDLKILGGDFPVEIYEENKKTLNTHDVVNMQYTSGTTGFPKGVMLTHYNILNNGKTIGDGMKFTKNDKLCITVPFFHCFGLVLAMMACITHGTTMVPVERYSPVPVMNAISVEKCTAVHGVPTMFIAMLEHAQFNNFDFSSLRTGIMAGSPCPIEVMKKVIDKMNMREIVIVFGQTEASPGCTMTTTSDSIDKRVNTVGRAFPGVECKIIDPESGEELPINTPGEFCARGYNIMKGYYKMPEATAQAIDKDGWLHTGDLCTVDEDGYYKVVGRIKDMIIRGGENIYPKEIEECLYTCDKVSDVQVIGVPSEAYGEEVMACVILKEGEEMTEEEVKEFVGARMAKHKVPRYVRFVDSFPTNAAGKIQKFKMREEAIEILKLQTAASIETA